MAEPKTTRNDASVTEFLGSVPDPRRRADTQAAVAAIADATGATPQMWGTSIVGFGEYHYRGKSGREGDWMVVGVAPRKAALTLYLTGSLQEHAALLERMGPHTTGRGCVYIKRFADVDEQVFRELVADVLRRYDGQQLTAGG